MTTLSTRGTSRPARKAGYIIAVVVNAIGWILINNRPGWRELPFLTEDFLDILWVVNLSIVSSAVVNVAYLFHDPAWFKSVTQVGVLSVGLAAAIRTWQVFPFDFSSSTFPWAGLTRAVLVLGIFGSLVAIVTELVKLGRLASGQTSPGAGSGSLHSQ